MKIFISPERIYPVAKQTENNKLTNLTNNIIIVSLYEVGNTRDYIEQNELQRQWTVVFILTLFS